jgi:hypothetical protein
VTGLFRQITLYYDHAQYIPRSATLLRCAGVLTTIPVFLIHFLSYLYIGYRAPTWNIMAHTDFTKDVEDSGKR